MFYHRDLRSWHHRGNFLKYTHIYVHGHHVSANISFHGVALKKSYVEDSLYDGVYWQSLPNHSTHFKSGNVKKSKLSPMSHFSSSVSRVTSVLQQCEWGAGVFHLVLLLTLPPTGHWKPQRHTTALYCVSNWPACAKGVVNLCGLMRPRETHRARILSRTRGNNQVNKSLKCWQPRSDSHEDEDII